MALGYEPNRADIYVSWGADWIANLDAEDTWPGGTTCWVRVGGVDHLADVNDLQGTAAFRVESEVCDLWKNRAPFTIYLQFPGAPTTEYAWFTGVIKRKDGVTA